METLLSRISCCSRGPRLTRTKQLDFMHRFMASPLVPSFAGDPSNGGRGLLLHHAHLLHLRDNWSVTILEQFHVQNILSFVKENASTFLKDSSWIQTLGRWAFDILVYASAGFFGMTGYTAKEVIGRNCQFLQGEDTDQLELDKIRDAIRNGKSYCGRILNYKKNGEPFWKLLTITPIRDDSGKVIKFIGNHNSYT